MVFYVTMNHEFTICGNCMATKVSTMVCTLEKYKLPDIQDTAYYVPNFICASEEEHLISKVNIL